MAKGCSAATGAPREALTSDPPSEIGGIEASRDHGGPRHVNGLRR